jgi:c(7)-type cytochrome triheme protein
MTSRATAVSLTAAVLAILIFAWMEPAEPALGAQDEKHGGDIVFEVKKNRQNLQHVLFSHDLHIESGHKCTDCHNDKVFKRERKLGVNSFTMDDVMKGKACGACHDGKTVVKGTTVYGPRNNCQRCHAVKWRVKKSR